MIKIIKAKNQDIENLIFLWKKLMEHHQRLDKKAFTLRNDADKIMSEFFYKNMKSKDSVLLIAMDNSEPIGYLMGFIQQLPPIYKENKSGFISDAFILNEFRKKWIMKNMVNIAKKFFKIKKIKMINLTTFSFNKEGVKAWKKMGFNERKKEMYMKIK